MTLLLRLPYHYLYRKVLFQGISFPFAKKKSRCISHSMPLKLIQ